MRLRTRFAIHIARHQVYLPKTFMLATQMSAPIFCLHRLPIQLTIPDIKENTSTAASFGANNLGISTMRTESEAWFHRWFGEAQLLCAYGHPPCKACGNQVEDTWNTPCCPWINCSGATLTMNSSRRYSKAYKTKCAAKLTKNWSRTFELSQRTWQGISHTLLTVAKTLLYQYSLADEATNLQMKVVSAFYSPLTRNMKRERREGENREIQGG